MSVPATPRMILRGLPTVEQVRWQRNFWRAFGWLDAERARLCDERIAEIEAEE